MGESAAAGAATSGRDVLLATKLNVPGLRPDLVPRPRLAQRLDEGQGPGLVLVCAPAGYGKTVVLADWVRRGRRPVAWLSLDAGDNDPARFWRHAVAALDRVRPGVSERMGPLLGPPPPPSFEPLVTALINEVAGQRDADEALLLVLDDYHVISSEMVHESLGFLLEHRPPGLHLALTSRSDPPLALARLRARGQLIELRAAELRFTPGEAAALLQQVAAAPGGARLDARLHDAVAAALAARTEGWAAGLQLAGLSLREQTDVDGFVAAFTGSHRHVLDFLTEEVLERQSEQVRTFLLETSVLERLSGELCDTVTGRPGSQALLEQIERAGLFLVPLDEVRGWWRYHHLFADLLRARLQAEQPGAVPKLHQNAAAWYDDLAWIRQATGDPAGALAAIGEAEHASPTTAGLLNPYPAQRARLLLAQGEVAAAARWTHETGLHADDEPCYPREPGYLVLARVLLAQQRPAKALALLDRLHAAAVAQSRVGSVIEAGALRALALAACGQDADAVNALADVLTLACPQGYVRVFADEGPPMAALLGRLIAPQRACQAAVGVPLGCLARLQRAFDVGHTGPGSRSGTAPAAVPGLVEQLTSRELEVLGMLAAGKPNQAIADQLVVTLDTVKKHVSHLLGKLGAANRTEAVTRARELGLIP